MDIDKIKRAKAILQQEADALIDIPLNEHLPEATKAILECKGKVVLSGMGKAGIVARKIAATFSSTGTPAMYIHPGEAQHGDLGAIREGDILFILSNSGKTREALELVTLARALIKNGIRIIVMTSNPESELGKIADISLSIGNMNEACPLGMAPTTSTTCMMALGDVLSLLVMEERGFTKADFAQRHHGGYLGSNLKNTQ